MCLILELCSHLLRDFFFPWFYKYWFSSTAAKLLPWFCRTLLCIWIKFEVSLISWLHHKWRPFTDFVNLSVNMDKCGFRSCSPSSPRFNDFVLNIRKAWKTLDLIISFVCSHKVIIKLNWREEVMWTNNQRVFNEIYLITENLINQKVDKETNDT